MDKDQPSNKIEKLAEKVPIIKDFLSFMLVLQADINKNSPWLNDPFSFQSMAKKLAFFLRLSVILNVAQFLVIVVLAITISDILPKVRYVPFFLQVDSADKLATRVLPASKDIATYDLEMERMAKRFPRLVLSIDAVSQTTRLQEAWLYASEEYYEKYKAKRLDSNKLQEAIDSGLNRSIITESAYLIDNDGAVRKYSVDFTQIDKRNGKEIETRKLRAYLALTTVDAISIDGKPKSKYTEEMHDNPFGIRVIDMTIKEKEAK